MKNKIVWKSDQLGIEHATYRNYKLYVFEKAIVSLYYQVAWAICDVDGQVIARGDTQAIMRTLTLIRQEKPNLTQEAKDLAETWIFADEILLDVDNEV